MGERVRENENENRKRREKERQRPAVPSKYKTRKLPHSWKQLHETHFNKSLYWCLIIKQNKLAL